MGVFKVNYLNNVIKFFKSYYLWGVALSAAIILSCGDGKVKPQSESEIKVPIYLVDELSSELPELQIDSGVTFDLSEFVIPYNVEVFPNEGYLVAADRTEKEIHLFDETGKHLGKAGGEGRGPGEFKGSARLHASWDNYLYTYDSVLRRITRFKVNRDGLSYVETYSPTQKSLTWLQNLYVTKWGNFGVVREMVDMRIGKDEFHF